MPQDHTGLKNFAVIFFISILLLLSYVIYRYKVLPTEQALTSITRVAAFKPVLCTVSASSFYGAAKGTVYISHGTMREDLTVQTGRDTRVLHAVLTDADNGTLYSWFDNDTAGTVTTHVYDSGPFQASIESLSCSPWWIPHDALLQVPVDVEFTASE